MEEESQRLDNIHLAIHSMVAGPGPWPVLVREVLTGVLCRPRTVDRESLALFHRELAGAAPYDAWSASEAARALAAELPPEPAAPAPGRGPGPRM